MGKQLLPPVAALAADACPLTPLQPPCVGCLLCSVDPAGTSGAELGLGQLSPLVAGHLQGTPPQVRAQQPPTPSRPPVAACGNCRLQRVLARGLVKSLTNTPPTIFPADLQAGKAKLPQPEGCPSKLYRLMQRCWALSPKDRPSFSEIANTLGDSPAESKP